MASPGGPRSVPWAAVLVAALALTAVAAWSASRLHVATRLEELLPEGTPAAEDYRRFLDTFGGFEKVYAVVLWRGGEGEGGEPSAAVLSAAADRLAEELAAVPEVAAVRSGLAPEDEAFLLRRVLPRAPLFSGGSAGSSPGSEEELRSRLEPAAVRRRVAEIRRAVTAPGGGVQGRWLAADPLGLSGGLESLASGGGAAVVDPLTGAFLSPRGDAALVIVTPASAELDPAAGRRLAAALERGEAALGRDFPGAPLAVAAVGGPLYAAQDEALVRQDMIRTVSTSALLVTALLLLYFGSLGTPVALVSCVLAGVAWTAGLTAVLHGEVSVLGLSFAALLLGLGVDYGIHAASRFRSARLGGVAPEGAVWAAARETGPAILASVVTTATAFLVLSLAHFRPVREMGQVMAGGVAAILAATVLVGGPALVLAGRWSAPPPRGSRRAAPWRALGRFVAALVESGGRRPLPVLLAAALLTLAAAWGIARLELSIDLRALRPEDHPAFAAEELLVDRFAVGLDASTVVVEGEDLAAALGRARRVEAALAGLLPEGSAVASPARWLVAGEGVERRLELLSAPVGPAAGQAGGEAGAAGGPGGAGRPAGAPRPGTEGAAEPAAPEPRETLAGRAAEALREALAAEGLAPAPFAPALEVLDAAARGEAPPPVPPEERPDWVAELVRPAGEGGEGPVAVALRLTLPLGSWPDGPPPEVLAAVEEAAPGAAVASVPRLGAELRRVVTEDFRRLGGWALAAVALVVLLAFRGRPRPSLLSLVPVTLGGVWTLGLAGLAGIPLDPFTIVVAPLLLGIGIDDGLHALAGARVHGGLRASVRENGRAMTLTTLTTCAGFGSLLVSSVPSLRSGGVLVAAGTAFCLLATLWVLPALDRVGGRRSAAAPDRRGEVAP